MAVGGTWAQVFADSMAIAVCMRAKPLHHLALMIAVSEPA